MKLNKNSKRIIKILSLIFIAVFTIILLSGIVNTFILNEIRVYVGTIAQRTFNIDRIRNGQTVSDRFYNVPANIPNTAGSLVAYEENTNFVENSSRSLFDNSSSFFLSWNNKTAWFQFYIRNATGQFFVKDLSSNAFSELNLTTSATRNIGSYSYNHTMNGTALGMTRFGYNITTENVTACGKENNSLVCDEQRIDFTQTAENFTVNITSTFVEFNGSDLSFIDPTVRYNGTTSGGISVFDNDIVNRCTTHPPPSGNPHNSTCLDDEDTGHVSGLDLNNDNSWFTGGATGILPIQLYKIQIQNITFSDITQLNFSWQGRKADTGSENITLYYWNDNLTQWTLFANTSSTTDITINFTSTNNTLIQQMINSTNFTHFLIGVNLTGQSEGIYTDYIFLTIDYTPIPNVTLVSPEDFFSTNALTTFFTCNATTSSTTTLDTSILYVWNASGTLNQTNSTKRTGVTNSTNSSLTFTTSGDYLWNCLVNNTLGVSDYASANRTFTISTDAPAITLNSPFNNTYFNNRSNIYLNYTAIDSNGISSCQIWHNLNGTFARNQTNTGVTSNLMNFTVVNTTSDSIWFWNIRCNDTTNSFGLSSNNFTFTTDTVFPIPNITSITTTQGSQTFTFNQTATDTNLLSCKYSIYNSSNGIDGGNENVSVTCGANGTQDTVSGFATFNLTFYATDRAGNENSTTKLFTTTASSGTPIGGGGVITIMGGLTQSIAANFSITTTSLQNLLDFVLAKDSIRPRERNIVIINRAREPIEIELFCDTESLNETIAELNITPTETNICDYVFFEETSITLSANELEPAVVKISVFTPENVEFYDVYLYNILAIRKVSDTEEIFAKLSVRNRVPYWGIIFKWSAFPFQDISKPIEEQRAYPVILASSVISVVTFIIVIGVFSFLRKKEKRLPFIGFLFAIFGSLALFVALLFIL